MNEWWTTLRTEHYEHGALELSGSHVKHMKVYKPNVMLPPPFWYFVENKPPLEVVSKLPYLHAVVSETLRMFPTTARLERCPTDDYILGDTGIKVPKGRLIAVPIFAMHYDPENFPDPHNFNPERFNEENVSSIRPYTYLPFGAGPRNCIGMRFALQAIKLCLLYAVHSVEFVRTEKTKVPLEFRKTFLMISAKDITIGIQKRAT